MGAGTSIEGAGTGLLLGGEVSVVDLGGLKPHFTVVPQGLFLDAIRDDLSESWRFGAGPELVAYPFVGFDLGVVLERTANDLKPGARLRYFVPFVFVLPYVGVTMIGAEGYPVLETGALLKFPIMLYD